MESGQHLVPHPPVARIHDQVANRPCGIIQQETLDVADLAVGGNQVMPAHRIAAAQMRVIIAIAARRRAQVALVAVIEVQSHADRHGARIEALAPQSAAAPVVGIAIIPR